MRAPIVFISSTYRDLKFERIFVACMLAKRGGFELVRMEEHLHKPFEWESWSTNRAMQCDILLQLYDKRIGSPERLFLPRDNASFVRTEFQSARGWAMRCITYQLKRPFPDYAQVFWGGDKEEYEATLKVEDSNWTKPFPLWREQIFRELHPGVPISSFAELEERLNLDLQVSRIALAWHRARNWKRCYWDNISAAWRNAFEDESHCESTSRLGLNWRLRKPVALLLLVWLAVVFSTISPKWAILATLCLIPILAVSILAYAPTFVWVGTKTLVARGAFALRTIQCPLNESYRLISQWDWLDRWCGLGALTVVFPDGRKIFVPLVNSPQEKFPSSGRKS